MAIETNPEGLGNYFSYGSTAEVAVVLIQPSETCMIENKNGNASCGKYK